MYFLILKTSYFLDSPIFFMKVQLNRVDDAFHFEASGMSGVKVHMDAAEDIGGHNAGSRPMELLLMGLGGCTAIDVVLILKKISPKN